MLLIAELSFSIALTFSFILLIEVVYRLISERGDASPLVVKASIVYVSTGLLLRFVLESLYLFGWLPLPRYSIVEISSFLMVATSAVLAIMIIRNVREFDRRWSIVLLISPVIIFVTPLAFWVFAYSLRVFDYFSPHFLFYLFGFNYLMALFYGVLSKTLLEKGYAASRLVQLFSAVCFILAALTLPYGLQTYANSNETAITFPSMFYAAHSAMASLTFLTWRLARRKLIQNSEKILTGIEVLDSQLDNGLPYPAAIVVMGPAGTGRTTILCRIAQTLLLKNDGVLFFSIDQPITRLEKQFSASFPECEKMKQENRIILVEVNEGPQGIRLDPQEINLAFVEKLSKLRGVRKWVIVDSFSTLIEEFGWSTAVKLLRILVQKSHRSQTGLLFSYNPYAFPESTTAAVEDCVNGVIEIMTEAREGRTVRKIRVKWMTGYKPVGKWLPLEKL
ncbi:MAG: ATPase domain-containing protein [Candidatus Caldarchaeum sp.]|nr:ATPase domain-containing protein [Candidatus Caldarchaeum sp.]